MLFPAPFIWKVSISLRFEKGNPLSFILHLLVITSKASIRCNYQTLFPLCKQLNPEYSCAIWIKYSTISPEAINFQHMQSTQWSIHRPFFPCFLYLPLTLVKRRINELKTYNRPEELRNTNQLLSGFHLKDFFEIQTQKLFWSVVQLQHNKKYHMKVPIASIWMAALDNFTRRLKT